MQDQWDRRHFLRRAAITATSVATLPLVPRIARAEGNAFAGRTLLLMVDDPGCVYCRKWEAEVESGYRQSAEGAFAPLEKRNKGHIDLAGLPRLAYTPTFLLLTNGTEAGRIVGYAGADWFWGEVETLYRKAGYGSAPASAPADERRT